MVKKHQSSSTSHPQAVDVIDLTGGSPVPFATTAKTQPLDCHVSVPTATYVHDDYEDDDEMPPLVAAAETVEPPRFDSDDDDNPALIDAIALYDLRRSLRNAIKSRQRSRIHELNELIATIPSGRDDKSESETPPCTCTCTNHACRARNCITLHVAIDGHTSHLSSHLIYQV